MYEIKRIFSIGRLILLSAPVFIFITFILVFTDEARKAVIYGLTVCGEIVIPSLYPFTCLCMLIYLTDINKIFNKLLHVPMKMLGLNGTVGTVVLMSLIGGYPVGGKLIANLHQDGVIDDKTANLLLMFCVNAGPSFVIIAVGCGMLKSYKAGVIIFACSAITSILMCVFLSLIKKPQTANFKQTQLTFSDGIVKSITDTTASILTICGYVIIFSMISSATTKFLPKGISDFVTSVAEVTNGCMHSAKFGIVACSLMVAFGGFAVHFQIFAFAKKIKLNFKQFYLGRAIHSILTALFTYFTEKLFPVTVDVGNFGDSNIKFGTSGTSVCSVALLLMSFVMICYWYLLIKEKQNAL